MKLSKLHFYTYTFCRYFLATVILSYAFAKILGTQFTTQPSVYDKPVGLLSGFELTWYYFGFSKWYGMSIAVLQIISSLLLFFRKTTRIGIILFLSFIVNILLVDFAYDIDGAKAMASLLTVMALFIFFSEYALFYKYLFEEPPLFSEKESPSWINKYRQIKWIYIPSVFILFFMLIYSLKNKYMTKSELYGTWQNVSTSTEINRLNFEAANIFKINSLYNNKEIAIGKYTFMKDTLLLKFFHKKGQDLLANKVFIEFNQLNRMKTKNTLKLKYKINKNTLMFEAVNGKTISLERIR